MKKVTMVLSLIVMLFMTGDLLAQNGATQVRYEDCYTLENPCCGDAVEICLDYHYTIARNGAMQHVNIQGSGSTVDGQNYIVTATQNGSTNIQDNGAGNYTVTTSVKLIATGTSDCSYTAHITQHVTMNSNGEITAEVSNITIECENGTEIN